MRKCLVAMVIWAGLALAAPNARADAFGYCTVWMPTVTMEGVAPKFGATRYCTMRSGGWSQEYMWFWW